MGCQRRGFSFREVVQVVQSGFDNARSKFEALLSEPEALAEAVGRSYLFW